MKRVLLTGPSQDQAGGVSTHVSEVLGSPLAEEYELIYFRVGSRENEGFISRLCRIGTTPVRFFFRLASARPHIVHLNPSFDTKSFWRDAVLLLIAKLSGKRVIIQFHGGRSDKFLEKRSVTAWCVNSILSLADKVIVLSEVQKKPLVPLLDRSMLVKLPNMIDLSLFPTLAVQSPSVRGGHRVRVVFLSKLSRAKGVYEILEAIPLVAEGCPDVVFCFVGKGEEKESMVRICREKSLLKYVEFAGYLRGKEKVDALVNSDIFVLPTMHGEGFPYAMIEAMAAGLPIITCSEGAIPEVVKDGVNGFLVPSRRPDLLAQKIIVLIRDAKLREKMGQINRKKALSEYNIRAGSDKFARVYSELIEGAAT